MVNRTDHIVIGCATLEQGVAEMQSLLGVEVPRGGTHPAMSTHNCLMQTGDQTFFELIAIDPDAPDPGCARVFDLDVPEVQALLAQRPRALTWVVNTPDLDALVAVSPVDLGEPMELTRGDLTWRLTVPPDGSRAEDGLIPSFIQWSPGPHPSGRQPDLGIRLKEITLQHPDPVCLRETLEVLAIGHLARVTEGTRALRFSLETATGPVELD